MRPLLIIVFVISLASIPAFGQRRASSSQRKVEEKPIKIDGVPEKYPVKTSKRRTWFLKWMLRKKVPAGMLPKFIAILEDYKGVVDQALDAEKGREKPRKARLKYFEKMAKWYSDQIEIVTSIHDFENKIFPLKPSPHPLDVKTREELEKQVDEKLSELKKVLKTKPTKPE